MIIGIDANEANVTQRVGVQQYSYELLWSVYRIRKRWEGKINFFIYLKTPPGKDLPQESKGWSYKIIPGGRIWVLTRLTPHLLFGKRPDVFFSPTHYLPPIPHLPKVCTIHDLGYLEFSEQFKKYDFWQLKYWSAISIIISKYIISVSESTKKDIVRLYPSTSQKIRVVYHAYDKTRFNSEVNSDVVRRTLEKYQIDKNYILFLSTLKPSKNIEGLLDAFKLISHEFKDIKLVIAGRKGWLIETIFKKIDDMGLKQRVIFAGFVSEQDKPALLAGARVFVSPSFWEGFGMHVLEAMACGIPVVISNVASLPEVAGKAGIYVNPKGSESIANGIRTILKMTPSDYKELKNITLKQAGKFDWKKTAEKTVKILIEAAKK